MPQISERANLIRQLESVLRNLICNGEENSTEFKKIMEIYAGITSTRCLNTRQVVPKSDSMERLFFHYPDNEFKQMVRMDKRSFLKLVEMIENHPVFLTETNNKQKHPWYQLMVVLNRLGCHGNGSSIGHTGRMAGVSQGSVCLYTTRVFTALLSLKDAEISWPDASERAAISRRYARNHGMPGVVGVVDGTPVVLCQRPCVDGEVFWTRKGHYAMNLQLVCDDRRKILFYQSGWPGSVYDATVFGQSDLFLHAAQYFSPGEFLIADAGYGGTWFICTPYRQPAASIPHNKVFNELFSSGRIVIEHVNGILKGRFSSLRGIRIQVKTAADFQRINEWITVCLVLHNILLRFNDSWEEEDAEDAEDEEVHVIPAAAEPPTAQELRQQVQNRLLAWYYANFS